MNFAETLLYTIDQANSSLEVYNWHNASEKVWLSMMLITLIIVGPKVFGLVWYTLIIMSYCGIVIEYSRPLTTK